MPDAIATARARRPDLDEALSALDRQVRADPGGSQEQMMADDGVSLYRSTSSPQMTYAAISTAPGFTVGERAEVELANGDTALLWPLRADVPFQSLPGVESTTTDMVVWTDLPGPTVRLDVTSEGVGGDGATYTGSSTTFYSQWGERVDLGELEEQLGAQVPLP